MEGFTMARRSKREYLRSFYNQRKMMGRLKIANKVDNLRMIADCGTCYEFNVSNIKALARQLTNPL